MCGFVGRILKGGGSISRQEIEQSLSMIRHRGPDESGVYINKNVALGHVRLSIIDILHGQQPMHSKKNRNVTIVYNGETYNFNELRRNIVSNGHMVNSYTDTEVILVLYVIYGTESFKMLNGMYAFCIYDEDKDEIYLCRDRFGIKPLYYMDTNKAFTFASEIKALKVFNDYKFEENYNSINEYLTFQFYISNETPYKNIYTLESGSYLVYKNGQININSYYKANHEINHEISYEEAEQTICSLLEDSINLNTMSDVPIGTYLSGGIDSSIVSSVLGISHKDINISFSGAFDHGLAYDESIYAKEVAEKHNITHKLIYPNLDDFINNMEKISYLMDYPESGPGVFPQFMVSKLASEHVKVVLGGQGGDEIFGGYTRYFIAYFEQSLKGAIFETQDKEHHIGILNELINNLPILKNYIPMLSSFWKDNLFGDKEKRYFDLINRRSGVEHLFSKEFMENLPQERNFEKFHKAFGCDSQPYFNRMTMFDLKYSMQGLLHVEDRVSMAHSIESRVPFLDYKLIDYVNTISPIYKFKGGKLKNILISAFQDKLPAKVVNRKDKQGFPVPLDIWKKDKRLQEFMADILLSSEAIKRGFYNKNEVEKTIFKQEGFSRGLWGVLNLELWLKENAR